MLCLVRYLFVIDCLERFVPEMTYYVSSGTLNLTKLKLKLDLFRPKIAPILQLAYCKSLPLMWYNFVCRWPSTYQTHTATVQWKWPVSLSWPANVGQLSVADFTRIIHTLRPRFRLLICHSFWEHLVITGVSPNLANCQVFLWSIHLYPRVFNNGIALTDFFVTVDRQTA